MRVMLDTNLRSYLGDAGMVRTFDAEVTRRSIRVMMAPSTLVEVLGHPKLDVR
ncbi:hypothetical protein [Catellatospora methionotrophica]|uniref:hypothetical protein n=1 Tax=Catellatospora methionotrophica TaxID=121620 RepID=UPI001408B7B3|nr:hypothetical protein [Catellatospora methionotrophica]